MPMDVAVSKAPADSGLSPFSLRDAPSLIERVFPAQKVGIEAQKERKAGAGQTLTALGSYWKGRKPLVLVRACVLASLLPATDDPEGDLELFEALMRMDLEGVSRRGPKIEPKHVANGPTVSEDEKARHLIRVGGNGKSSSAKWRGFEVDENLGHAERKAARSKFKNESENIRQRTLAAMSFSEQIDICGRVEEVERVHDIHDPLYSEVFDDANLRLGTTARTLAELVEQLGIARFGQRPVVGDPFAGGGSIPFEAARVGCDVVASDLNPVAAMLTWGALNLLSADCEQRKRIAAEQKVVTEAVENEIANLGIEENEKGDRAKAYFYCVETVDPQTGWRVPMSPTWVIGRHHRCIAKMVPDHARKRFDLVISTGADVAEMEEAGRGSVRDGYLVYGLAAAGPGAEKEERRISIAKLRGDGDGRDLAGGGKLNRLRPWSKSDVAPREPEWQADASSVLPGGPPGAWVGGDIWLERLYCIQWIDGEDLKAGKRRPRTKFSAPDAEDLVREAKVRTLVKASLAAWQSSGFVPDMPIESGVETARLLRERGWTHWHHLFTPRQLHYLALVRSKLETGFGALHLANVLNFWSRLCGIHARSEGSGRDTCLDRVFINQALNTLLNYGCRASSYDASNFAVSGFPSAVPTSTQVRVHACSQVTSNSDLWIYDPPYADAVHYHEITEYFIAWLRKNAPPPMNEWTWDSRRPLAIQGKGEKFRSDMVHAFRAMADHMPDNGLQVCMFTHKDAGVWADMAGIVWGAGLRVTAAWYVSTETTSELKKGGYIQGTVLLVLRKRQGDERAYKDELVLDVRAAVQRQVDLLTGLNQSAKARQRDENPFSDADLQMAGYAAALEVLTGYTHIEGVDMTREALRPRVKGQRGIVEEMIDLAVQTATELMRPGGIDESMWERLVPTERFWLKMTEAEANRLGHSKGKLDDYQNFAKAYRADGWDDLMADRTPNKARLKGAVDFKRSMMTGHPFAAGLVRPVLYAVNELRSAAEREEEPGPSGERAISGLRDNLGSWAQQRQRAMVLAEWLGKMLTRHRPDEASAARTLAALIRTERLG